VPDERVDRQRARHAVDEREHVRAERGLQLGVLVEVVEHDLRDGVALEHDDEALPLRPDVSSRMSAIPATRPSRTSSAIFCASMSGLTWYGSSVTTRHCRPWISSTSTTARMMIEPRPVRYASSIPLRP
jgi:hypothetical protein